MRDVKAAAASHAATGLTVASGGFARRKPPTLPARRAILSNRVLALVATSLSLQGCKPGSPKPTAQAGPEAGVAPTPGAMPVERRLSDFLGVDLASKLDDKACKEEHAFQDNLTFKTTTCVAKENAPTSVYVTYLVDERFPQFKGRLWRVYAVLGREIWAQSASLKGYMDAFAKKYGPLEDKTGRSPVDDVDGTYSSTGKIKICRRGEVECSPGGITYEGTKVFNSLAFQMIPNEGKAFRVVGLMDFSLTDAILKRDDHDLSKKAAAAVE